MSAVKQTRPRRFRYDLVLVALGCMFTAGLAVAMPAPRDKAAASGSITFSGAIVAGTCAVPASTATAGAAAASAAQGQCHTGQSRSTYRVNTADISDTTGIVLLQYANQRYRNAKVVTYTYD